MPNWRFAIDVGGTFTDAIAVDPDGGVHTVKVLSSGRTKGRAQDGSTQSALIDEGRRGDPPDFWRGYRIVVFDDDDQSVGDRLVSRLDSASGRIEFSPALPDPIATGARYELFSDEPAPLLAIRIIRGLRLDEPIGAADVRLGSTRATNALLERKGAPTVFVTTRGFGDILRIGNQDRPHLFRLDIVKPEQLATRVIELDERIAANGSVLTALDSDSVRSALSAIDKPADWSVAICLLNAYANPAHERIVADIARQMGFGCVSVSTEVSPIQKIVPRGDTTVADAYLQPVIRRYLESIQSAMPEARLRVMTSAGGLVAADRVAAKDTLLSGPAGGVVGFAAVARAAGFAKAIGFDMGGTSTDVARFDGEFEREFETVKGGVRVCAPMLAVETVAAGGGSICDFDGQRLTVGPRSAGADPGPACYGGGGPLTVTDVNQFLGRLPDDRFAFALDEVAPHRRLQAIADKVNSAGSSPKSLYEIADGFVRIANEHMAAAIRRVLTEKGFDAADYVLVAFGGAASQHACAVAELLCISRVLISPHAGILSAVGIGQADIKRATERTLIARLDEQGQQRADDVLDELIAQLRRDILADGVSADDIQSPRVMLDLRYVGEESTITTTAENGDYAGSFERTHTRLYGYAHQDRDIEIVTVRAELTALTSKLKSQSHESIANRPSPSSTRAVWYGDVEFQAGVFDRDALRCGDSIDGPAVILEKTSTIVVDPDWSAEVISTGDILLTTAKRRGAEAPTTSQTTDQSDPIQLELFNRRFAAIAERMGVTLRRTALSTNVKERLDYSCAIFDADGDLVVNAPHMPVHLGSMSDCVKMVMADVSDLSPGDVVLTNDPFRGGTHVPDLTCVSPVFAGDGQSIRFFVASRAHHAEIGSIQPGSMPAQSTRLIDEGVVFRNFRLVRGGVMQTDALRAALTTGPYPSRAPNDNIADLTAQIAANQTGINDLLTLMETHGDDLVRAYMGHIQRAAERKMRTALSKLPDNVYRFDDALDDGTPICVAIAVHGDRGTINFTGSGGVHPGNFNANPAIVRSAVLYCFRCLIDEDIPLNAGVLLPLCLEIPPGLLKPPIGADPSDWPAVAAGNVETSQRLVDVLLGALGLAAASQGTMNNLIFGSDKFGYYETIAGGAGAGPGFAGASAVQTHMTNTRQTDPEILESRYPVRLQQLSIRCGSGGDGANRGGDGLIRTLEFLSPLLVSIISQRRTRPPYGLAGGSPGAAGRNTLIRADGTTETLAPVCRFDVLPGDTLTIETPGGGGYGSLRSASRTRS